MQYISIPNCCQEVHKKIVQSNRNALPILEKTTKILFGSTDYADPVSTGSA